jgi:hypothetical protein
MVNEIPDAVLTLLRRRPARFLLMLEIVMREIGGQRENQSRSGQLPRL